MATLRRYTFFLHPLLLPVLWAPAALAQASGTASYQRTASADADYADLVDVYLLDQMRLNHIPSISVAVVREGWTEILKSYGTANLERGAGSTVGTAYQLASATKPLTGTAVMLLLQEGRLSLDDSLTAYVASAPKEWGRITIRHLVTHSSGISDDLGPGDPKTAAEALTRAAAKPLDFEPGSRSSYGIGGYAVLQSIIEQVSGVPYTHFLRERLLDPLGMTNTDFDLTVPLPATIEDATLSGDGWTIKLASGWVVRPGLREGDLQLLPEDSGAPNSRP